MMTVKRLGALALSLMMLAASPALAEKVQGITGTATPMAPCFGPLNGEATCVDATHPLPVAPGPLAAATSTPQDGNVTSSAVTPTSGTATFSGGTATIGPFSPVLGRDLRVVLRGTWAGTFQVGTSVDNCVTINPLTVAGMAWGSYSTNANEVVDTPTLGGVSYCAVATITSGTLYYAVRQ